jgi:hypothetical protein
MLAWGRNPASHSLVAQSYARREKMRLKFPLLGALIAAAVAAGILWSRLPLSDNEATASTAPGAGLAESSAATKGVMPPPDGPALVPQIGFVQKVIASDFTLTDSLQPVPGLWAKLAGPLNAQMLGDWKVEVCVLFETQLGDEGRSAAFTLRLDGVVQPGAGVTRLFAGRFQTTCFAWILDLAGDTLVEVMARKDTGATGSNQVLFGNVPSRLIATELFPDLPIAW